MVDFGNEWSKAQGHWEDQQDRFEFSRADSHQPALQSPAPEPSPRRKSGEWNPLSLEVVELQRFAFTHIAETGEFREPREPEKEKTPSPRRKVCDDNTLRNCGSRVVQ